MKGTAELVFNVRVLCERCERPLRTDVREGVGNIPAEIYVVPCEYCEEEARRESVEEERRRKI